MKWIDNSSSIDIFTPQEFSFDQCLAYLDRSDQEALHKIKDGYLYKVIRVNDNLVLCKIGYINSFLKVEFPINSQDTYCRKIVGEYIYEYFDLDQNLNEFYNLARKDKVLNKIVDNYYGLRIMSIPDLFEAIVWAIIGQQINLTFAYKLKKRFVEKFGDKLDYENERFWVFPSFEKIADIDVDDLRELQFTSKKAEYIIGIAKAMKKGELKKEELLREGDYKDVERALTKIRGIGAWTANYVMMRCLHNTYSLPIADVGLHNAIKNILGPSIEEIEALAVNWEGWQAYGVFYLWRTLNELYI